MNKLLEISDRIHKNSYLGGNASYSPDGRYVIAGSQRSGTAKGTLPSDYVDKKYPVSVWNAADGKLKVRLLEHESSISSVTWNSSGGVASADSKGNVFVWV